MKTESVNERLEEASRSEQRLYRRRVRLLIGGGALIGILLTLATLYTLDLERRAKDAAGELAALERQKVTLTGDIDRLTTAKKNADEARARAEEAKAQVDLQLKLSSAELSNVRKAFVDPKPQSTPFPFLTDAQKMEVQRLVDQLYDSKPANRGKAYAALMKDFRREPFVIETVIKRGEAELSTESPRDLDGLYNSLVTLTDLSRSIIQKSPYKQQIGDFADAVAREVPPLRKRAEILKGWLEKQG